ncbi:MAG: hypothetical protein K2P76_07230 [Lachnospiraceae bacterium]|nr:hypothetical protein [Lachnospiraceae bacterium]
MAEKKERNGVGPEKKSFTREQILHASRYEKDKDILDIMLEKGKTYTHGDIQKLITTFRERRVN